MCKPQRFPRASSVPCGGVPAPSPGTPALASQVGLGEECPHPSPCSFTVRDPRGTTPIPAAHPGRAWQDAAPLGGRKLHTGVGGRAVPTWQPPCDAEGPATHPPEVFSQQRHRCVCSQSPWAMATGRGLFLSLSICETQLCIHRLGRSLSRSGSVRGRKARCE